jgi:hypothetical protein
VLRYFSCHVNNAFLKIRQSAWKWGKTITHHVLIQPVS